MRLTLYYIDSLLPLHSPPPPPYTMYMTLVHVRHASPGPLDVCKPWRPCSSMDYPTKGIVHVPGLKMLSSKGVPLGDNLMVIRFIVLVQLGRMALLYPAKDNNVMMWTSLVDTSGFCPPLNVMLLTISNVILYAL